MDLMQVLSTNLVIVIILGLLAGVAIAYMLMINARYPNVKIKLYDRGNEIKTHRRRIGDMLVHCGFMDLLFNTSKLFGEDIKNFDFLRIGKEKWYVARLGAASTLMPVRFNISGDSNIVEDKGIIIAKKLAMEYVNLIDEVNKTLDKNNPFIIGLLSVLPLAIVILLLAIIIYLVLTFFTTDAKAMIDTMKIISDQMIYLQNATASNSSAIIIH
jgi:hypothetical protein